MDALRGFKSLLEKRLKLLEKPQEGEYNGVKHVENVFRADELRSVIGELSLSLQENENPLSSLLNSRQMAARLNVSLRTLSNWASQRKIPYVKLGRAIRFNASKVIETLEKNHGVDIVPPPRK